MVLYRRSPHRTFKVAGGFDPKYRELIESMPVEVLGEVPEKHGQHGFTMKNGELKISCNLSQRYFRIEKVAEGRDLAAIKPKSFGFKNGESDEAWELCKEAADWI